MSYASVSNSHLPMSRSVRLFHRLCYGRFLVNMLMNLMSPETSFRRYEVHTCMRFDGLHVCRARCGEVPKLSQKCRKISFTWVRGHSRSSNLAPIERAHTTSYYWLTFAISRTLSELRRRKGGKLPFRDTPDSSNAIAIGDSLWICFVDERYRLKLDSVGYILFRRLY